MVLYGSSSAVTARDLLLWRRACRTEARRGLFESARDRGPPGRDEYFGRGALDMPGTVR